MKTGVKLWLGVGAVALTQAVQPGTEPVRWLGIHAAMAQQPQAVSTDAGFGASLVRMAAQLDSAEDLVKAGEWDAALPHFTVLGEELYEPLTPELKRRGAPEFKVALDELMTRVKAKTNDAAYIAALAGVRRAIGESVQTIPAEMRSSPGYIAELVSTTLRAAAEAYAGSIEEGKIVAPVEYQDGRGYLGQAKALVDDNAAALGGKSAGAFATVQDRINKLAANWPTPMAPETPVLSAAQVSSYVAEIEAAGAAFR